MKCVMLSIQPKWCDLILAGKKTVEIRRNRPTLETPFKVYIYCTLSGSNEFAREILQGDVAAWNRGKWGIRKGNVIGEFLCDRVVQFPHNCYDPAYCESCDLAYVDEYDLSAYLGNREDGYGWHISDLVIYDEPKPISDFYHACDKPRFSNCTICKELGENSCKQMSRPPQSWCYVEEL